MFTCTPTTLSCSLPNPIPLIQSQQSGCLIITFPFFYLSTGPPLTPGSFDLVGHSGSWGRLKMLGEDDVLMCIPTNAHLFDLILGSKKSQCPMLSLDPLFMMIQLLVIRMWLVTWSYCISTFMPIDLDCHSLHLFDSGFIAEPQPSPTCWILNQAIWISGSQIIHHSSDSSVLGEGVSNFALIFAQYSWQWYSLKATLSNFNISPSSGWMLHSFLRYHILSSSLSTLGEDHHF